MKIPLLGENGPLNAHYGSISKSYFKHITIVIGSLAAKNLVHLPVAQIISVHEQTRM